jgi:hypothetical protein
VIERLSRQVKECETQLVSYRYAITSTVILYTDDDDDDHDYDDDDVYCTTSICIFIIHISNYERILKPHNNTSYFIRSTYAIIIIIV